MPLLMLPLKEPVYGRETLLYIPGASRMDRHQLQEIIHWQTEKTLGEMKARGPQPKAVYSRKEIAGALRDFMRRLEMAKGRNGPRYR